MMTSPHDDWRPVAPSWHAMSLMGLMLRRGGGAMRMGPLLKRCGFANAELVVALNELHERLWIDIHTRGPGARQPESLPENLRHVRRITTTHCGRMFYPRYCNY